MNRPIRNLAIGCLVLFLALLINVTYLQYWQSDSLTSLGKHPDNRRVLDADFARSRGSIVVRSPRAGSPTTSTSTSGSTRRVASTPRSPASSRVTGASPASRPRRTPCCPATTPGR